MCCMHSAVLFNFISLFHTCTIRLIFIVFLFFIFSVQLLLLLLLLLPLFFLFSFSFFFLFVLSSPSILLFSNVFFPCIFFFHAFACASCICKLLSLYYTVRTYRNKLRFIYIYIFMMYKRFETG